MSTDYKIGDRFYSKRYDEVVTLSENDLSSCPFFTDIIGNDRLVRDWGDLTRLSWMLNAKLTEQLRKVVKQLELSIKELER